MSDRVIVGKITRAGMRALFNASNSGVELKLTTMAIGTAGGTGYVPTGNETRLLSEFMRVAIGGGGYVGDFQILVQALFAGDAEGWINELGVFDENGTLFMVWSEVKAPIAYKSKGVPFIGAITLAISEIPPNSLTVITSGPSVNITIGEPFARTAREIMRLQGRDLSQDVATYSAQISRMYR